MVSWGLHHLWCSHGRELNRIEQAVGGNMGGEIEHGRGEVGGLVAERGGGAHELGRQLLPCITEVEALSKGHIHEGTSRLELLEKMVKALRFLEGKECRTGRWFRWLEEEIISSIDICIYCAG